MLSLKGLVAVGGGRTASRYQTGGIRQLRDKEERRKIGNGGGSFRRWGGAKKVYNPYE